MFNDSPHAEQVMGRPKPKVVTKALEVDAGEWFCENIRDVVRGASGGRMQPRCCLQNLLADIVELYSDVLDVRVPDMVFGESGSRFVITKE